MSTISPRAAGSAPVLADAFFTLLAAIDAALLDACHWPTVLAELSALFPLRLEDGPTEFPSIKDIGRLRQLAAVAAWEKADAQLFASVCSHLEGAARVRSELLSYEIKSRAALHALDYVGRGVVLVDKNAKVVLANEVAGKVLAQRDGLCLQEEHLMAMRTSHNAQLRQAIEAVATNASPSAAMAIPRPSLRQLITLSLTPAKARIELAGDAGGACDLVLVFVNDPEQKVFASPDTLCRMYGLTRSEATLACHLLAAETLEEAARAMDITPNTARTHLRRIFMKTDTNRQSQLVLLLMGNAVAEAPSATSSHAPAPVRPRTASLAKFRTMS